MLKQLPCIPLVENLLKDGTDGCALAALIHFYCPDVIKLEGMSAVPRLNVAIKVSVSVFVKEGA